MGYTLEQLSSTCRDILTADRGPEGRKQVCAVIRDVLLDTAFTKTYLVDDGPERKILYEDPELGFCILAHVHQGAKESQPHDHGPSWAIYGQAQGKTVMSDWAMVEAACEDKPGKVRHVRSYTLGPMAHVYTRRSHSPRRDGPTRLLRFGAEHDHVRRCSTKKCTPSGGVALVAPRSGRGRSVPRGRSSNCRKMRRHEHRPPSTPLPYISSARGDDARQESMASRSWRRRVLGRPIE